MTKIINIYGGPCSGKSTASAGLFYKMKMLHMSVELVTEYAKDLVYGNRLEHMLDQQEYIFAKQNQRLHRLLDKVDYVITDSPTLLSNVYVDETWCCAEQFKELVICTYNSYDNLNIYLHRPEEFQQYGRAHSKEQSEAIDTQVIDVLRRHSLDFYRLTASEGVVNDLLKLVLDES